MNRDLTLSKIVRGTKKLLPRVELEHYGEKSEVVEYTVVGGWYMSTASTPALAITRHDSAEMRERALESQRVRFVGSRRRTYFADATL